MARYLVRVRSPRSPAEAFAYMANLANFAEWDPGVTGVEQSEGDGPGPSAVFDVTIKGLRAPLRYRTTRYEPPDAVVVRAESRFLTSLDTITVEGDGAGSIVTYDAELTLNGLLGLADPLLRLMFGRIGDRAAAGLLRVLDGERIQDRASMTARDVVDALVEAPVVTSFTRIGYAVRARLDDWRPLGEYDLSGRVIVLTGATSGLGRAAAGQLADCGATLVLVGRHADRNHATVTEIIESSGNENVTQVAADMGDYAQVRALANHVLTAHDRLDVLIHNAGALTADRRTAPDGTEATVASQVVGPFLLTGLLLERLAQTAPSRVLTMSSGGMYSAGLTVSGLQMSDAEYRGAEQYARAKRAQVVLNEMWAERFGKLGIHFHAMHPGWASTPGVDASLPTFSKVMGPLLRSPAQGADTLVWLAADDTPLHSNGGFWLDRRPRRTHKLRRTKHTDTTDRRRQLWAWVSDTCGYEPSVPDGNPTTG